MLANGENFSRTLLQELTKLMGVGMMDVESGRAQEALRAKKEGRSLVFLASTEVESTTTQEKMICFQK